MPFYALVSPASGEIVDVVLSLDAPVNDLLVIELPAPGDNPALWARISRDRGGGASGKRVHMDHEAGAGDDGRNARARERLRDAEHFFARLDEECRAAAGDGRTVGVLLFDLAPPDRLEAQQFVIDALASAGQEVLATDVVARVRDHLVAVLLPNVDAHALRVNVLRGEVTALTHAADRAAIESLRKREHPLLRRSLRRIA
jgi:hypothetical protein